MVRGEIHESVQTGSVVQSEGNKVTVQFNDGEQKEVRAPMLAGCPNGHEFQAFVGRDINTFKIRSFEVIHAESRDT